MNLHFVSPSWEDIYSLSLKLAERIKSDGFKPDVIVGITRGGWVPARIISDVFHEAELVSLGVAFYTGIGETEPAPKITQPLTANVTARRVLLVDDVADTGRSLKTAVQHIQRMKPTSLKAATIYRKPHSEMKPEYYGVETDAWIVFPWEKSESTERITRKLQAQGVTQAAIHRELESLGLGSCTAERMRKK